MQQTLNLPIRYRSPATMPGYRKGQRPANYGRRFPGEVYEPEEVLALLAVIPNTTAGLRDQALFAVLWRTGIRISEALSLRELDLHESTGYIRVRRSRKNARGRDVYVFGSGDSDSYGWDQLRPWLDRRADLDLPPRAPLFCTFSGSSRGGPIRDAQVRNTLQRYVRMAGLHGRFHLHGFRHTLTVELFRDGVRLPWIQRQLGHASLAVTQYYLEQLGVAEAMDALALHRPSWRAPVA